MVCRWIALATACWFVLMIMEYAPKTRSKTYTDYAHVLSSMVSYTKHPMNPQRRPRDVCCLYFVLFFLCAVVFVCVSYSAILLDHDESLASLP